MKTRIITALICLPLFFVVFFLLETPVFTAVVSLLLAIGVHELLQTAQYGKKKTITAVCIIFATLLPWFEYPILKPYRSLLLFVFAASLFLALIRWHEEIRTEQIAQVFFVTIVYPMAFTTMIYIRDQFEPPYSMYYVFLIFACAWLSDAGAYFAGYFFGKHKMAPKISPKKTVEGLIGGVFTSLVGVALITLIFGWIVGAMGMTFNVNYISLSFASVIATIIGVFGDLLASVMKRHNGIKDYGTLLPGHGGIIDRFDSVFFVAPFMYVWLQIFTI